MGKIQCINSLHTTGRWKRGEFTFSADAGTPVCPPTLGLLVLGRSANTGTYTTGSPVLSLWTQTE